MIIKVSKGNNNWHFLGEVAEVSTKILAEHELPAYDELSKHDIYYQDYDDRSKLASNIPTPPQIFYYLEAKLENRKSLAVVTDKMVFLLNNDGKTIERL